MAFRVATNLLFQVAACSKQLKINISLFRGQRCRTAPIQNNTSLERFRRRNTLTNRKPLCLFLVSFLSLQIFCGFLSFRLLYVDGLDFSLAVQETIQQFECDRASFVDCFVFSRWCSIKGSVFFGWANRILHQHIFILS